MTDCIFCKLADIPVVQILKNENAYLIPDKNPMAPHHVLAISKQHFNNVGELSDPDRRESFGATILGDMFALLHSYAEEHDLDGTGYRIVINTGKNAGQVVSHLHIHLLGGTELGPLVSK